MILVLIVGVLLLGAIAIFTKTIRRNTKAKTNEEDFPSLSFDSLNIYRPIRALRRAILETVQTSSDPAVHALSDSVTDELGAVHSRVVLALQTRDQLRKAVDGQVVAQTEMAKIKLQMEAANSPDEKLSFSKAFEAKKNELSEYEKAKEIIQKIEGEMDMTRASLSELKAKLVVSGASSGAIDRSDDLRSSLGSLETIQSSVDEAQAMLHP
jgi:hypothetical protein